jgi:hypothetical protein
LGVGRFGILIWLAGAAMARAFTLEESDVKVGGYVDGGRFQVADTSSNGEILNRMGAKWAIDKSIDSNWSVRARVHWMFWRNQATDIALFHIAGLKFDSDLEGAATYRTSENLFKVGLYEFKYNPDSKNLGEYLLRSEAYPTIIENSQGKDLLAYSFSRVAGVQFGRNSPRFRQTALAYAEQYNGPVNDVSFAYLAAAGSEPAEIGAGIALHRQFKFGKPMEVNNLSKSQSDYLESQKLTTRALKFSLRGRLDVGRIWELSQDFKVYGEVALLGIKNDSLFYKHPAERMPMMVGTDLPSFGWLDVLSLELEYLKNPYYGRKYSVADETGSGFSALPNLNAGEYAIGRIPNDTKDDWKWSLFLHKALNRWIDVKARVASDHLRLRSWDGGLATGEPMTQRTRDWYVLARLEFHN